MMQFIIIIFLMSTWLKKMKFLFFKKFECPLYLNERMGLLSDLDEKDFGIEVLLFCELWKATVIIPSKFKTAWKKLDNLFIIYYQINRCKAFSQQFYTRFRCDLTYGWFGWVMVFNATFNNISVICWLSVLLVEETGVPRENHRPTASHWQTLSHNIV